MIGSVLAGNAPQAPVVAPIEGNSLFHPVPDEKLREFEPDRPDKTNGAHTLDAGHVQLEMDAFSFTRDRAAGVTTDDYLWANLNLRVGLLPFADLQLFLPTYLSERTKAGGAHATTSGTGDFTAALKLNAWGNEGYGTSSGVELYVKTPTGSHALSNGKTEGGAILLWGTPLPAGFDLGVNSGVAVDLNDSGSGYHADLFESISASHALIGGLAGYLEFYTFFDPKHTSDWQATVDVGLTYGLGKNLQLDAGVNFGITAAAPDRQIFAGLAIRY